MIAGTVYGVALNDREQQRRLAAAFQKPPYGKAPLRPILYIKPRNCVVGSGGSVPLPPDLGQVEISATSSQHKGTLNCGRPNDLVVNESLDMFQNGKSMITGFSQSSVCVGAEEHRVGTIDAYEP